MIIAVPKERLSSERRVAVVPGSVPALKKLGHEVWVEAGAGLAAGYPDTQYEEKGARLADDRDEMLRTAEMVLTVRTPGANPEGGVDEAAAYRQGQVLIGLAEALTAHDETRALAERGVTLLAMELLPRITRAQTMDVLSSQANLAGYKAALIAADLLPKMLPLMMTAAGTIHPAKVLVIGAGVAGLQAIATAHRLGAVVSAYDVRPAVKEQVQSLGAKFVELPMEAAGEAKGGYAKEQSEEQIRRQQELMARVVAESDAVITTALIPGKRAPVLVTAAMVERMAPGSVVVDLAAERGGNCELTRPGETVEVDGVKIVGETNLPSLVAYHASQMYSNNLLKFIQHLTRDGRLELDPADEITAETLVCRDGQVVHPRVRDLMGMAPPEPAAVPEAPPETQ